MIDQCVLSRVNAAQASLSRNVVIAGKVPNDAWQNVGGDANLILISEEGGQYGCSSRANRTVGAWIGGIECGRGERRPGRVTDRRWISVSVGLANSSDGPPQLVVVFGVVEGDGAVGEGQVECREQSCAGLQVRMVCHGVVLGNLIPGVPDRSRPELGDYGLISGPRLTVFLAQTLHLVDGLAYAWLVNAGGGPGRNCAALLSTKGVTLAQVVNTGAANFGGVSW